MAAAYHMEALRKQRIIERKHAALGRIAICQVGILLWSFIRRIVWSVFMVFNGIFLAFWWIFGVKTIPHRCFTFLTLVHNCTKWAKFLISPESWALFIETRTGVKSKECQILNEFLEAALIYTQIAQIWRIKRNQPVVTLYFQRPGASRL